MPIDSFQRRHLTRCSPIKYQWPTSPHYTQTMNRCPECNQLGAHMSDCKLASIPFDPGNHASHAQFAHVSPGREEHSTHVHDSVESQPNQPPVSHLVNPSSSNSNEGITTKRRWASYVVTCVVLLGLIFGLSLIPSGVSSAMFGVSRIILVIVVVGSWLFPNRAKKTLREAIDVPVAPEERDWADDLRKQHGEFVARETFAKVANLRGYAPVARWRRFLGFYPGTRMDMVVAHSGLLFFDPAFRSAARLTAIPAGEIQAVRTDYSDASTLIIQTGTETVLCDTGRRMGAKAISGILHNR